MKWVISPWTSDWNTQYGTESKVLQKIFQDEMVEMHHVGSTSVPAIGYAKPIIDILIIVRDIERISSYNDVMIASGYRVRGENGIAMRRYFTKGESPRTHHVHIYQVSDPRIATYLDFKAYLLEHPDEANTYGLLKLELLRDYSYAEYQSEKEKRMQALVEAALRWGQQKRSHS